MCREKEEYIQLPPMKKSTPSEVVELIWDFVNLSKESREKVRASLKDIGEDRQTESSMPEFYKEISHEEIADFEETVKRLLGKLIVEASHLACWVYDCKYNQGLSVEDMIKENEKASEFILTMSMLFDMYRGEENKYV